MAMFREHIAFGAIVAAVGSTVIFSYALVTDLSLLALLFGVTVVASFLPDLDSDSGMPYHLIFGTFTVLCTGAALYYTMAMEPERWEVLVGVPLGVMVFVWVVVGGIFKNFTTHRGMMHSIPAAVIAGLATFLIARHLERPDDVGFIFGAMAGAGYLSHLILDELYSGINIDGSLFRPTKALGTALKFFSSSSGINIFTYLVLALLVYSAVSG